MSSVQKERGKNEAAVLCPPAPTQTQQDRITFCWPCSVSLFGVRGTGRCQMSPPGGLSSHGCSKMREKSNQRRRSRRRRDAGNSQRQHFAGLERQPSGERQRLRPGISDSSGRPAAETARTAGRLFERPLLGVQPPAGSSVVPPKCAALGRWRPVERHLGLLIQSEERDVRHSIAKTAPAHLRLKPLAEMDSVVKCFGLACHVAG
ncbi:unnamed protein product [Nesidiocoris tenuis]|uniref:Uncharacterized protein n=1 Tax=Nesidiocoris tenuis TaxID=355587 RepID=A0A6H5HS90_9HEMI|nr:unnamed protein product [Nesidiocoris tenuis]